MKKEEKKKKRKGEKREILVEADHADDRPADLIVLVSCSFTQL